jgi:hypothetical protein
MTVSPSRPHTRSARVPLWVAIHESAHAVAEAQHRQGALGLWRNKTNWISLLTGPEIADGTQDAAKIQRRLVWIAPPDPKAELARLWNLTAGILEAEWPGIVFMARKLRDLGEIEGMEFEDIWRGVRGVPRLRERRLTRAGLQIEF